MTSTIADQDYGKLVAQIESRNPLKTYTQYHSRIETLLTRENAIYDFKLSEDRIRFYAHFLSLETFERNLGEVDNWFFNITDEAVFIENGGAGFTTGLRYTEVIPHVTIMQGHAMTLRNNAAASFIGEVDRRAREYLNSPMVVRGD